MKPSLLCGFLVIGIAMGSGMDIKAADACGHDLGRGLMFKWQQLGERAGILGCPTADESDAPVSPSGTKGRWASFGGSGGGMIVWHANGPHVDGLFEVHGCNYALYKKLGSTGSWLGFPISDVVEGSGGRRSDFEGGHITGDVRTGKCRAFRKGSDESSAEYPVSAPAPTVAPPPPVPAPSLEAAPPKAPVSSPKSPDLSGVWCKDADPAARGMIMKRQDGWYLVNADGLGASGTLNEGRRLSTSGWPGADKDVRGTVSADGKKIVWEGGKGFWVRCE